MCVEDLLKAFIVNRTVVVGVGDMEIENWIVI